MKMTVQDVTVLAYTFPWPKRALCYLLWMNRPFRWIMHGLFGSHRNPYRLVVALYGFGPQPEPGIPDAHPEEGEFGKTLKEFAAEALGEPPEEAP